MRGRFYVMLDMLRVLTLSALRRRKTNRQQDNGFYMQTVRDGCWLYTFKVEFKPTNETWFPAHAKEYLAQRTKKDDVL